MSKSKMRCNTNTGRCGSKGSSEEVSSLPSFILIDTDPTTELTDETGEIHDIDTDVQKLSERILPSSKRPNEISKRHKKKSRKGADTESRLDCQSVKVSPKKERKSHKYLERNKIFQRERDLTEDLFGDNGIKSLSETSGEFTVEGEYLSKQIGVDKVQTSDWSDEEAESDTDHETAKSKPEKRKAAWVDEDDENTKVKNVAASYSKAKGTRGPRETSEAQYKKLLDLKFAEVYGAAPEWAKLDRPRDDESDDLYKRTGSYLASKGDQVSLPKTNLDFRHAKDLNGNSRKEGVFIRAVDFCPELGVALVAGHTKVFGAASLFQFDGAKNHFIKSTIFPRFPVKCARFLPGKQQFVVGSNEHSWFFVYDIKESKTFEVFRKFDDEQGNMKKFEISPDHQYIASVKSGGWVYFIGMTSLSVVEKIRVPAEVADMAFNSSSTLLFIHTDCGQVYVYDLVEWRCKHRFYDDGCVKGSSIALSPDDRFLACGSFSGIVNVYETSSVLTSQTPRPLKAIKRLLTKVDSLQFHPSSEMLAVASSVKDNAIRLFHVKSLTVFQNFPGAFDVKRVQTVKFSPDGKFLAVGNCSKAAVLFRLLHY